MKFVYFFLPILALFAQCCSESVHINAAHKVMNSFNKKMKKDKLHLFSSGGAMMDDIQQITLGYEAYKNLNVSDARILFIKKIEALLSEINSDLEIRPYLHDYPFTSRNIFFKISFCKDNGEFVDPPYIAYVSLINIKNRVYYSVYDQRTDMLKTVYEESYEEALKIYHETLGHQSKIL